MFSALALMVEFGNLPNHVCLSAASKPCGRHFVFEKPAHCTHYVRMHSVRSTSIWHSRREERGEGGGGADSKSFFLFSPVGCSPSCSRRECHIMNMTVVVYVSTSRECFPRSNQGRRLSLVPLSAYTSKFPLLRRFWGREEALVNCQ